MSIDIAVPKYNLNQLIYVRRPAKTSALHKYKEVTHLFPNLPVQNFMNHTQYPHILSYGNTR